MNESSLIVYQAHPETGEYIGVGYADSDPLAPDCWLIPAMAFREAPPATELGFKAVHTQDSANVWSLVRDERGVVYRVDTGEETQWRELGELPDEFTSSPPPSPHHRWDGSAWYLDESVKNSKECVTERSWRNWELDGIKWLRERHRDESDLKFDTTLTEEQFSELLAYFQLLREWPQNPRFPASEFRPIKPVWMKDLVQ